MVEHVAIQDADRHEVKHASTATDRQVLTANGDGTTEFAFVDYANITGIPAPAGYRSILFGSSNAASQQPVALDTALQVEFGPGTVAPEATLSAAGAVTFTVGGEYYISLFYRFGRTSGAGTAVLLNRVLLNGAQILNSNGVKMTDDGEVVPFSAGLVLTVNPGDILTTQIARDSAGINNGGIFRISPTVLSWNQCPSASISVSKFIGTD